MPTELAVKKSIKKRIKLPVLKIICRFFASAASIAGEIMPFGTAFYAADFKREIPYIPAIAAIFWSITCGRLYVIKYAAALIFFTVFIKKFTYFQKKALRRGMLMGGCVFFSGFLCLAGNNILLYDIVLMASEAALNIVFCIIFDAFDKAREGKEYMAFSGENVFFAASTAAAVNLGISCLINFYGFSFSCSVAAFMAMLFSCRSNISAAAAAGLILGFSAGADNAAVMMCSFGIASMCASYFSSYGKSAAALAFLASWSALLLYFDGFTESLLPICSTFFGAALYVFLPTSIAYKIVPCTKTDKNTFARVNMLARQDIINISSALTDVADTFLMLCDANVPGVDNAATVFFDKTIKWVCVGCKRAAICWKKDFHLTYAAFFVMLRVCEEKGEIKPSDLPESIRENCLNPARLITAYNTKFESYKTDKLWESRINEGRFLIASQLKGISKMLCSNAENFYSGVRFESRAETVAEAKLAEHHIDAEVNIFEENDNIRAEVNIFEGAGRRKYVEEIIRESLGAPMQVIKDKGDTMSLVCKKIKSSAFCKSVVKSKSEICGDSFGRIFSPFGSEYFILSDGMGSGETASRNSRAAVSLVKNMIAAGFEKNLVFSMVNSIFMLKSSETSFATLDIVLLEDGAAHFSKVGAAESYVKTQGEIVCVKAESLPAGVTQSPEVTEKSVKISHGSLIVMLSDGVSEALCDKKISMEKLLDGFSGDEKALCKYILSVASSDSEVIADDLTVAVIFIL